MGDFFFIKTLESFPSLGFREGKEEIRLHSSYRPTIEAEQLINSQKEEIRNANRILIYGLGLGYHLQALDNYRKPDAKVDVVEMNPDILPYVEQVFPLQKFCESGYNFCISDNLQQVKSFLLTILAEFDLEKDVFFVHRPSLRTIPSTCTPLKYLLEEWEVNRDNIKRRRKLLEQNFLINIKKIEKCYVIDQLHNKFFNIPTIIVSAGPSLSKNIHLLKEAKGKSLIIAVGSVVKPLLNANIFPDCIVISDPLPGVINQIAGLNLKVPLFFLPTIQPRIVNDYLGPKIMLLQQGVTLVEEFAVKNQYHLIKTGGSVATTALEIALYLGSNPIIFTGQDLAYTNGQTHVPGTTHDYWVPEMNTRLRLVKGVDCDLVPTSSNLAIYKRWIERTIADNPDRIFFNATEGGANIEGTIIRPFKEILRYLKIKYPIEQMLDKY